MNPENESRPTYEPILQRRLDMMAQVISWWQRTTDEEHVAIMRLVIEQERLEAELADGNVSKVGPSSPQHAA